MAYFAHEKYGVRINLPEGLTKPELSAFKPFNDWLDQLQTSLALQSSPSHPFSKDPYTLHSITIQAFDRFGPRRLGFVKLQAAVANSDLTPAKSWIPGAVFLRGPSVAILAIITPEDAVDGDEKYVPMVVQPRVAVGSLAFVELPAGMVDDQSFVGAAAQEIAEELDFTISKTDLISLTGLAAQAGGAATGWRADDAAEGLPTAMYPSCGACDEYIELFLYERRMTRAELKEVTGKLTGLRAEGEKITLKLVRLQDLWLEGLRDGKCLAALALYENLERSGTLERERARRCKAEEEAPKA